MRKLIRRHDCVSTALAPQAAILDGHFDGHFDVRLYVGWVELAKPNLQFLQLCR
jgi:hypothetical protein